jgi:phosphatidylethanolamine/phosphatidyl-N-methylethanolamine N-methyltransferase
MPTRPFRSEQGEDHMSEYALFWRGLIDHPRDVSAPTPSSPALAASIAAEIDPRHPGLVVELGPGTGVVTQALLGRGIAPERLIVIETSEYFCALLARRFAGITVIQGDALDFEHYLPDGAPIAAIVSGLPLLNFSNPVRGALIRRALDRQGPHGCFIQLSYGWVPAVPPCKSWVVEKKLVWRNLPPAHVWTYRHAHLDGFPPASTCR